MLLNPNSKHYETHDKPDIMLLEDDLTVHHMIGACLFNLGKYALREKGQNEADIVKMKTYSDYLDFLQQFDFQEDTVSNTMRNHNLAWIEDPTFTEPA